MPDLTPTARRTATAAQAALLLNPAYEGVLHALGCAGSAGAGAAALAILAQQPLSTVHARLEKLLLAGVVEVAEVRSRAGRPVRVYALPPAWRIPFEVTPAATLRELLEGGFRRHLTAQLDALAGRMLDLSAGWHIELNANASGLTHLVTPGQEIRGEPLSGRGFTLRLRRERAHEFLKRLNDLLHEYQEIQDEEPAPEWRGTILFTPQHLER